MKSTARLMLEGETIEATGWAREPLTKKGMEEGMITGTAASYSGKRALGNLFAIDDTKDSDHDPNVSECGNYIWNEKTENWDKR